MKASLQIPAVATIMLGLIGCAHSPHDGAAVLSSRSPANLALGPTPMHAWVAEGYGRAAWPVSEAGRRYEDVTVYWNVLYDEQSYYDEFGGMLHESQSVRSGVRVR